MLLRLRGEFGVFDFPDTFSHFVYAITLGGGRLTLL
jgi:hypothetical protein